MSIQRIDCPAKRTHGWQARACAPGMRRLTAFFSDSAHGGRARAYELAAAAHEVLWRKARRMRKSKQC
jgi:hypothetical protein